MVTHIRGRVLTFWDVALSPALGILPFNAWKCYENSWRCIVITRVLPCVWDSDGEDGEEGAESLKRHYWASPLGIKPWPHWRGAGLPMAQRVIQKDHRKVESGGRDDDTITEQFQGSFLGCQKLICRCWGCRHITSCWWREKPAFSCSLISPILSTSLNSTHAPHPGSTPSAPLISLEASQGHTFLCTCSHN